MASEVLHFLYMLQCLQNLLARFGLLPYHSNKHKPPHLQRILRHTTTVTMPKDVQFTAYDLERKKARKLDCPPKKILASQLDPREWARATKSATAGGSQSGRIKKTRGRAAKKKTAPKLPKRALDVLKIPDPYEWTCLQCQKGYDDPDVCISNSTHQVVALEAG